MSTPTAEQLTAALATVQDPEIKRPITELGMVDHLEVDDAGRVSVTVLLTVSGCPMKDTIDRDVRRALTAVDGVTGGRAHPRRDDRRAAGRAPDEPARRQAGQGDPVRPAGLADQGVRDRQRQGRRRQVVGDGQPRARDGQGRPHGRHRRRRHLRPLGPRDARHRRLPAHPGRGHDHARPDAVRGLGDLDRHAQAAARPGRRLARPDARPGAGADAGRRLLGRPRRPPARPAARHRRHGDLARPAPARTPRSSSSPPRRRRPPRSPSAPARWPRCSTSAWSASSRT